MDYVPINYGYFEDAFKPPAVFEETKGFSEIRSYVYIIRKKFNPYQLATTPQEKAKKMHTKLNLFKIGMSSMGTRDPEKEDKGGIPRLSGLRTGLINFDVFRIYIFGPFIDASQTKAARDTDSTGRNAEIAEQWLHSLVENHYPHSGVFRINFRGDKGLGEVRSEWFKVGDSVKEEKKFLKFIDNAVFAIEGNEVANARKPFFGTGFEKKSMYNVLDTFEPTFVATPKEQTKEQESRLTPYQKKLYSNLRKTSNIYRREANQIEAQLRRDEEEKKQRADDEKRAEELSLPLKHWEKILSGKIIHMPEGDQMGNWHNDRIRKKRIIGFSKHGKKQIQVFAKYEPVYDSERHKRKMLRQLTPEQVLAESGDLRVNEVLDYFPSLLKEKKTKAAFDYFNRTFSRNPDQDLARSLRKEGQTNYLKKK